MMSVCDQVNTNASAVRQLIKRNLKKNESYPGLLSYEIGSTSIIHCFDPPHIIKGIRNNLMTKNLKHRITTRWNINHNNHNVEARQLKVASWDHVVKFYEWSSKASIKMLRKITPEHINPGKKKMKVNVATQVFSQSLGNAMLQYATCEGLPKNLNDTAQILLFFNDVFDSINGSCLPSDNKLKSPVSEESVHFSYWHYALRMISTMQFYSIVTDKPTFRTSVLSTLRSTILGYMEIFRLCLNLNMKRIALRYPSLVFFFVPMFVVCLSAVLRQNNPKSIFL